MSVIGRLDSQVEEVIIAPIARRHERKTKEREQEEKQAPAEKAPHTETKEPQSGSDQTEE